MENGLLSSITAYLSFFSNKKNEFYNLEKGGMGSYEYSQEVNDFLELLDDKKMLENFDWQAWLDNFKVYEKDLKKIADADLDDAKKMLTVIVRGERFNGGLLAKSIDNGMIIAILKRLEKIDAAVPSKPHAGLEKKAAGCFTVLFILVAAFVLWYSQLRADKLRDWSAAPIVESEEAFNALSSGDKVVLEDVQLVATAPVEKDTVNAAVAKDGLDKGFALFKKYKVQSGGPNIPKTYSSTRREQIAEYLPDFGGIWKGANVKFKFEDADFILPVEERYTDEGKPLTIDVIGLTVWSGYKSGSNVTIFSRKGDNGEFNVLGICGSVETSECVGDISYYRYISLFFVLVSLVFAYVFYRYGRRVKS